MAKIKVLMSFIDIHTDKRHHVGEVFEASEERISEIQSVDPNLIQVIPETETVGDTPKRKRKKAGEE